MGSDDVRAADAPTGSPRGGVAPGRIRRRSDHVLRAVFVLLLLGTLVLFFRGVVLVMDAQEPVVQSLWLAPAILILVIPSMIGLQVREDGGIDDPVRRPAAAHLTHLLAAVSGVGAVLFVVTSAVVSLPVSHVVGAVLGAVGVGTASWIIGLRGRPSFRELSRGKREGAPVAADLDWTEGTVRRRALLVAAGGIVGALVPVLLLAAADAPIVAWPTVLLPVVVGALGASVVSMVVTVPLNAVVRPLVADLDGASRRRVTVRVRGGAGTLEPDLEWRAARIAVASRAGEPFSIVGMTLLLVGLGSALVAGGEQFPSATAAGWAVLGLAVVVAACLSDQHRRLRRYADSVRGLAASPRPEAAPGTEIGSAPGASADPGTSVDPPAPPRTGTS